MANISIEFPGTIDVSDPDNPRVIPNGDGLIYTMFTGTYNDTQPFPPCGVPVAKAGDEVVKVFRNSNGRDVTQYFESVISNDGEIKQLSQNYSQAGMYLILRRP